MTAYYVIIESVTTLWLWVGWLWKCNIPMTQSVRRLSIIRSVCHNFLKGVICKIMHIIYKIVKMAPRHCSVVGCKSSSKQWLVKIVKKSLKGDPRQGGLISTRQFDSAPQGLVFPSRFVFKALCIAESVLRCELEKDWLCKKILFWLCEY